MPRKSNLKLPPLNLGTETIAERLNRLRKEKGLTQKELAIKIGIIQSLISSYENNKLRLHPEMLIRFSIALGVSADEILGIKVNKKTKGTPSLKIVKRLNKIEKLKPNQQKALLQTLDTFLKGAGNF